MDLVSGHPFMMCTSLKCRAQIPAVCTIEQDYSPFGQKSLNYRRLISNSTSVAWRSVASILISRFSIASQTNIFLRMIGLYVKFRRTRQVVPFFVPNHPANYAPYSFLCITMRLAILVSVEVALFRFVI